MGTAGGSAETADIFMTARPMTVSGGGLGDDTLDGGNGTDHLDSGPDTDVCTRTVASAGCERTSGRE